MGNIVSNIVVHPTSTKLIALAVKQAQLSFNEIPELFVEPVAQIIYQDVMASSHIEESPFTSFGSE